MVNWNKPYHRYQCIFTPVPRVGGFPFEVRLEQPNKETIAAMLEAERIAHDLK